MRYGRVFISGSSLWHDLILRALTLALLAPILSACGKEKYWDGGEFAGQPVYDRANRRFSTDAIEALKACGVDDGGIEDLAKSLAANAKEIYGSDPGSLSGKTITWYYDYAGGNSKIITISFEALRADIYEVPF